MATAVRTVAPGVVAALLWVLPRAALAEPASAQHRAASGGSAEWEEAPAPAATVPEPAEPRSEVNREPPEKEARPAAAPVARPHESEIVPVYEPPPPPVPEHVAPANALWLGARGGGWLPFGTVWARCDGIYAGTCKPIPYSDYSGAGPLVEVDIGARLSRHYNVFVLWEHAALAGPSVAPAFLAAYQPPDRSPASDGAQADYYAVGTRFSSNPDRVGFLAEVALGFRRMSVKWEDGTKLSLSNAPFEFRLGLGADLRLSQLLALSPMFTVGTGVFGDAEWSYPDGSRASGMGGSDLHAAHGWLALELGGHLDFGR